MPMPPTQALPVFAAGQTVGTAERLNVLSDALRALTEWEEYAPAWTAANTAPSIGNGTLVGRFIRARYLTHFAIQLTFGSTSSGGAGVWSFGLPTLPLVAGRLSFTGTMFDTSAGDTFQIVADRSGTNQTIRTLTMPTTAGAQLRAAGGSTPFTWATGDIFEVSGTYASA